MDIEFRFGAELSAAQFEVEKAKYDVVCVSPEFLSVIAPGAAVDGVTMRCTEPDVISALAGMTGVLDAALCAKKAALTVDRLAQNLDPMNNRGDEGACETRLITNMDGVADSGRVLCGADGYTREEAAAEAARCIQCSCVECVKGCVYLQHYNKYPKKLSGRSTTMSASSWRHR
jgi:hypothetical protein